MAEVDNLSERGSLLDAFATTARQAPPPATVPAAELMSAGGAGLRVIGAQKIAVPRDEPRDPAEAQGARRRRRRRLVLPLAGQEQENRQDRMGRRPVDQARNDVSRYFGNDEIDVRVIDLGDSWLIYARFTDYETGYSLTRPFQQRKSQRTMGEDADRQRDIAFQIGCSKAIRNVVVNALQSLLRLRLRGGAQRARRQDRQGAADNWRDTTVRKLEAKVELKRVEAVLGRAAGDWLAPDVAQVIAMMKAIATAWRRSTRPFRRSRRRPSRPAAGQTRRIRHYRFRCCGAHAG